LINTPDKSPFAAVLDIGIAIRTIPGPDEQVHIGLLHKIENQEPQILNLRNFTDLKNEPPTDNYRWVQVDLDEANRRLIVALCRTLAKTLPKIPFGFTFNRDYLSPAGEWVYGEFGDGLTCATFVLAVFRVYRIPLLRTNEWPPASDEDRRWQAGHVRQIKDVRGPFVAEAIARHIGAPRFRPEHVTAAAANSGKRPLGVSEAERLGRRIVAELVATYH
jgi:hypothetical protein